MNPISDAPGDHWPIDCRKGDLGAVFDLSTGERIELVIAANPGKGMILQFVPDEDGRPLLSEAGDEMEVRIVHRPHRFEAIAT